MTIASVFGALIIGLVIGVLGRLVLPGKQNVPIWLTILVGVVAAFIGSAIVGPMSDTNGIDWIELLAQVVLAMVGVAIADRLYTGRSRTRI